LALVEHRPRGARLLGAASQPLDEPGGHLRHRAPDASERGYSRSTAHRLQGLRQVRNANRPGASLAIELQETHNLVILGADNLRNPESDPVTIAGSSAIFLI
jgi:hypothetical protein